MQFFSEAHKQNKDIYLLVVGDGPAREQLERRTHALGIADHVKFAGMVKPSEVQDDYQPGDVSQIAKDMGIQEDKFFVLWRDSELERY